MKKSFLIVGLILSFAGLSHAENKPPHYGDWDVIYDKVMKSTTLIHQHRPYGQPVPGMGDALTTDSFQLQYSFKAVISGVPGTKTYKAKYYLLFDDPINRGATLALAIKDRFFKYSPQTQFTLLCDDNNKTFPIENYHTGEFGDAFIGHRPFEEFQVVITKEDLAQMLAAKEVAGNLSSDDQNANKSFQFDKTFKEILTAFLYHIDEINDSLKAPK